MRLVELEPRWIDEHVFVFRCPHCLTQWLSCKNAVMSHDAQWALFDSVFGEDNWNTTHVLCADDKAWKIKGRAFDSMTVSPSLNAEPCGHWHGNITKGEIVGGEQIQGRGNMSARHASAAGPVLGALSGDDVQAIARNAERMQSAKSRVAAANAVDEKLGRPGRHCQSCARLLMAGVHEPWCTAPTLAHISQRF